MERHGKTSRRKRLAAFSALLVLVVAVAWWLFFQWATVLTIRDWESGEIYAQVSVRPGDELYFGWVHSLEKIPWNEYYHISGDPLSGDLRLVLDTITFPAFGAGIPENKGQTRVAEGLIYMENIGQIFPELKWLNSPYTKDIALNGQVIASGHSLPEHRIIRLVVERRGVYDRRSGD